MLVQLFNRAVALSTSGAVLETCIAPVSSCVSTDQRSISSLLTDLRLVMEKGSICSDNSIKKEDNSSHSSNCVVDTTTKGEELAGWRGGCQVCMHSLHGCVRPASLGLYDFLSFRQTLAELGLGHRFPVSPVSSLTHPCSSASLRNSVLWC